MVRRAQNFLSPMDQRFVARRYAVAFTTAAMALLVRWMLDPVLGHSVAFYIVVYMAVAFCVMVSGLGPAIVCAVTSILGTAYLFVVPVQAFSTALKQDIQGLVGSVLVCAVLIALGEANRRKHAQLDQAHSELERRVEERTAQLSQTLARLEREVQVRREAEEQLRRLSLRLMTVEDDERRRIARNLHDAAGQTMAALKMTIASLQRAAADLPDSAKLLDDMNALADEALQEIRTTSFLLHPPLLDEAGFASAARWFVDGFRERSGIAVTCSIPEDIERLPSNVEMVLFRVLQESLTNVHRHSEATAAWVTLVKDSSGLRFEVSDNGRGLPEVPASAGADSSPQSGLGIAGMRERVRELGGQLTIEPRGAGSGTSIIVALAMPKASSTAGAA
jgi:signal transduction histidine kinase